MTDWIHHPIDHTHSVCGPNQFLRLRQLDQAFDGKRTKVPTNSPVRQPSAFSRVETGVVVVADLQLQEWLQDGWPLSLASQSLSKSFPPLLPSLPLCLSPFTLGWISYPDHLTYSSRLPSQTMNKIGGYYYYPAHRPSRSSYDVYPLNLLP